MFENKWLWFKDELGGNLTQYEREEIEERDQENKTRGYKKLYSLNTGAFNRTVFPNSERSKFKKMVSYSEDVAAVRGSLLKAFLANLWIEKKNIQQHFNR